MATTWTVFCIICLVAVTEAVEKENNTTEYEVLEDEAKNQIDCNPPEKWYFIIENSNHLTFLWTQCIKKIKRCLYEIFEGQIQFQCHNLIYFE